MKALVITNVQHDFLPGGALPVPQAEGIIPVINQLQGGFKLVVATQLWYPASHCSFAANHAGRISGESIQVRKQLQKLWPVHCVQKTKGAEFASSLWFKCVNRVFKLGLDPDTDSYSGFYDKRHVRATGLGEFLKEKRVTEVFIVGLTTEYSVKHTALDALALGFKTRVIEDACCSLKPESDKAKKALAEMKEAGAKLLRSEQLLKPKRVAAA